MTAKTPDPVVVLAYDGVGADEAGALIEILMSSGMPVIIASVEAAPITSYHGQVVPQRAAGDIGRSSAIVIPGGMGVGRLASDRRLQAAIQRLAEHTIWLGATSTGSVLLAAAGLADGARVTTHWLASDLAAAHGVVVVDQPFVEHGRLLTASGLASTAALAFRLIGAALGTKAEAQARATYHPASPKGVGQPVGSEPENTTLTVSANAEAEPAQIDWGMPTTVPWFAPPPSVSWWRRLGRKQVLVTSSHDLDPTGAAEVLVLDLSESDLE